MTIEEHITEKTNALDLEKLTATQREWLHYMRTLATWAYISKIRREGEATNVKSGSH
jgi:hypothetical protein